MDGKIKTRISFCLLPSTPPCLDTSKAWRVEVLWQGITMNATGSLRSEVDMSSTLGEITPWVIIKLSTRLYSLQAPCSGLNFDPHFCLKFWIFLLQIKRCRWHLWCTVHLGFRGLCFFQFHQLTVSPRFSSSHMMITYSTLAMLASWKWHPRISMKVSN